MAYINIYNGPNRTKFWKRKGRKKERNTMDEILEKQERNVEQMTNLDS